MKSIYQITSYEDLDNCSIFEYKNYALEDFYSDLLELESFRQRWYHHINEQSNSIGYDDSSVEYESETELANDITTNGANNCCSQFETYRKCDMSRTLAYNENVPMLPESEFGNISCENMENLSLFQIENYSPEDFRTDLLEFENSGRQRLYRYFEDKTSFSGQDDSEPEIDFPENLASCSQFETFRKYDQTSTSYDAIVSASMNASNIDHKIHYYSDVTDNGDDTMESESDSNNDSRLECDYDGDIEESDDEDNFSTSYDAIVSASMNASNIDHKIHYYSDVTDNGDDTMESESDSNNDSRLECDYDGDIEESDDEDNF
uniref:Uncharacterized protein n=1 Tax=Stomoxys calcitrans TaxID=35570 RepID=A0A1I8PIC0_STOCA